MSVPRLLNCATVVKHGRSRDALRFDWWKARNLLHNPSLSIEEIAVRVGTSTRTLRRYFPVRALRKGRFPPARPLNRRRTQQLMARLHIPLTAVLPHGNRHGFDRELAVWLVADGNTPVREIARRLGIGQRTLYENIPVAAIRAATNNKDDSCRAAATG